MLLTIINGERDNQRHNIVWKYTKILALLKDNRE